MIFQADQKQKQNHRNEILPAHPQEQYLLGIELGLMSNHENNRYPISQHARIQRKDDGAIEFWRIKDNLQKHISCIVIIGLTTSGRKAWQEEETRKDFSTDLILQEQFCTSELFEDIEDAILLILLYRIMSHSGRFLQVHLSRRMCDQFTFHHQFRIDTRRTKFEQNTDGILHVCGSNEQGT